MLKLLNDSIKVEFHCHTNYSYDSNIEIVSLINKARIEKIDRIAITDHNTVKGALIAKELAPEIIIVGEEIKTQQGEIIGLFLNKEISKNLNGLETIDNLNDQKAFIIIPHPFDFFRSGHWLHRDLLNITSKIDAIEIYNSRCIFQISNFRSKEFSNQNNVPAIVGSDAHELKEVGKSTMLLPAFNNASQLRLALNNSKINISKTNFFELLLQKLAIITNK